MFTQYLFKVYRTLSHGLVLIALVSPYALGEEAISPTQPQLLISEIAPGFRHQDISNAASLLKLAKITGDERYLGMAEARLALLQNTDESRLLQAEILHARHHFETAETLLQALLKQQPGNRKALLMLAANQRQRGLIDAAKQSCARLLFINHALSQDCLYAAALGQQGHRFQLSRNQDGDNDTNLWRDLLRAEFAETQGNIDLARNIYHGIWQRSESLTVEAWVQYAHFLRREGLHYELKQLLRFAPAKGELLSLRAFVNDDVNEEALAEQITLQERHPEAKRHAAEIAWFYHLNTNSARSALHWAQVNWNTQRSLRDAELLVRTALVAGQKASIEQVTDWMTTHNVNDQRLLDLLTHYTASVSSSE